MQNLPPVLLDEVLMRAGFAAAREACKVSKAWRVRAERESLWRFFILKQWPTLGQVVEALEKREEPGILRKFFRNRVIAEYHRRPTNTEKDFYDQAWPRYYQPLYLQVEAWLEGPNKTRRNIVGFTVHLAEQASVANLLSNQGMALGGLPEHLTIADLGTCSVELTVLDTSRGISMSIVEGKEYLPETANLMQCRFFAGTHYCASLYGSDVYLRLWPRLVVHRAGSRVDNLRVRLELERVNDEIGECNRVVPSAYQFWSIFDKMMGLLFRARDACDHFSPKDTKGSQRT